METPRITLFGSLAILLAAYIVGFGCYLYAEASSKAMGAALAVEVQQSKEMHK